MPDPNLDAPKPTLRFIKRFGGLNPYGLPNWRVCLAQNVLVTRAGIFHETTEGDGQVLTYDEHGRLVHNREATKSVTTEGTFRVPRYPKPGWILERWQPAHLWGTREQWESQLSEGTKTPMMGPYPEEGDYWLIAGPFPHCPPESDLELAMGMYERSMMDRPTDVDAEMKRLLEEDKVRQERLRQAAEDELAYKLKHSHPDILKHGQIIRRMYAAAAAMSAH